MKKLKKIQRNEDNLPVLPEEEALVPVEEGEDDALFSGMKRLLEKIRLRPFPWKRINAKNALIAGCLVLIAVAGYLNIRYGGAEEPVAPPMQESGEEVAAEEDFFVSAVIDRERARGEALEVLVSITENEDATETAKNEAYDQMERIANETSWEIDIENLVKAKGFAECVAIISEDSANIVVNSSGLTGAEIAQIKEIVYLESSIEPKDVRIIEKSE
ncbi:MAG: SpoIIIAH-like family protein [Clostridia bacterium]|nr:SpoIIIAH-like family protein [Clostridia bacterium]